MGRLKGRTVVITGAARGLGREVAFTCAAEGARLVVGDLLEDLGRQTVEELKAKGAQARFIPLDLEHPWSIEAFAADIAGAERTVDGLVNNAAIATNVGGKPFEEIDIELWDRVMRVNVRGTWLMTRAMSPLLVDGSGRVVNMASDTALWGPDKLLAYVSSKGAVISMTRSLSRELGARRIGIVAVAPGIMRCEATAYVPRSRHEECETRRSVKGPQELGEVVDFIAFLLTDGALTLTGQVIVADNGFWFN